MCNTIGYADKRFSGTATAFPHLKFQHKNAYFRGKWHADAAWDAI
jgi:hypothetical protein